jgi:hypothetical protein
MDFNATIDLIIKDLNEASEIIDDLKKYPGVPALQVELAKSKCRSAGDVIALLKSIGDLKPGNEEPDKAKPLVQLNDNTKTPEQAVTFIKPIPEKNNETKPSRISSPATGEKSESAGSVKKKAETSIIADKFSPPSDIYSEQTASNKTEKELSDRLKARPIVSISEAIGISDKFLFIGEIFDGNKEAYAQAISRLDKAQNLSEALTIISSYAEEKSENEAVSQLLDLVKLKLGLNE